MLTISQYGIYDYELHSTTQHEDPFRVQTSATFKHESGTELRDVPAFYSGGDMWTVRFSPPLPGQWQGKVQSEDPGMDGLALEPLTCVANAAPHVHGRFQIDPQHPQRFAWEDGTPCVPLGFEWDWLFSYHQTDPARAREHLDLITKRGFNYIVTNIYAHTGFSLTDDEEEAARLEGHVYGPPQLYVFGGSNEQPDHDLINLDFFADFDKLMRELHRRGIVAHLMIQVQNKHVNWPERDSPQDDAYWRYVVARYQAFGNVVWDVGKESYNLLQETGSHAYTLGRITLIRNTDAYDHLVTVHDAEAGSAGRASAADRASDFISDQIHLSDVDRYHREALRKLQLHAKPYMNIEYGYELGAEPLKTYRGRTTAPWEDVLVWTYALYLAGAYPCYYYSNTSWDLIKFEPEPPGWVRYQDLREVLAQLPFNDMQPHDLLVDRGHCLAQPGEVYWLFLPEGGDVHLDLTAVSAARQERGQWQPGDARVTAEWLDIYSRERRAQDVDATGWSTPLANPLPDPTHPCSILVRVHQKGQS